MPRTIDDDEPAEEDDDWDGEDDSDEDLLPDGVYHEDEDEGEPTVKCPYCGNEVAEIAQYCPRCENYLSKEDMPREPRSAFLIVMLLLALLAAVAWVIG